MRQWGGWIYVCFFILGMCLCVVCGIWICLGVWKSVFVWVRLSHIKASCHRLPNIRQAPVFWLPTIHFHSAPCSMTKSVESMIYLFSFLINSSHLHALLFFLPFLWFSFLGSFPPFPWRDRGMFLCCKMAARWMSFVQSAATFVFVPQLRYQKDMKCSWEILKLFSEGLKQQNHPEKRCGKGVPAWSSTSFQTARWLHS